MANWRLRLTRLSTYAIKSLRTRERERRSVHSGHKTSCPLLMLPFELRDMILDYLPLTALVFLKMSCRDLYRSGAALPILMYRVRKCPDFRFEVLLMQEKDRPTKRKVRLLCSQCKQYHPASFFARDQQLVEDNTLRLCKGGTNWVDAEPGTVRSPYAYTRLTRAIIHRELRGCEDVYCLSCDPRPPAPRYWSLIKRKLPFYDAVELPTRWRY